MQPQRLEILGGIAGGVVLRGCIQSGVAFAQQSIGLFDVDRDLHPGLVEAAVQRVRAAGAALVEKYQVSGPIQIA